MEDLPEQAGCWGPLFLLFYPRRAGFCKKQVQIYGWTGCALPRPLPDTWLGNGMAPQAGIV
jgi:hypothetical protein